MVALEAERINNDVKEAVPADYDKMAAGDPEEAIWVAIDRDGAHTILQTLNESKEGEPRVEKTYSEKTTHSQFKLDQPGCTDITTLGSIHHQLEDGS